jgi:alpha-1,2-mannosyltransferase
MYVIYPLLCYNAVHAIHFLKQHFESLSPKHIHPLTTRILVRAFKFTFIVLYAVLSLARILAQLRAFGAPMQVYGEAKDYSRICLGKEWYRFPSSFFVPENSQALFVKSAFDGLLPGRFLESEDLGWRSGIWKIPRGMNDRNLEEISHLVTIL